MQAVKLISGLHGPAQGPESEKLGLREYEQVKSHYLALCRRHGLNPFDLCILSLALSRIPRADKIAMVGAIVKLIRLERALKRRIAKGLFPLTVEGCERSGYLTPVPRKQG